MQQQGAVVGCQFLPVYKGQADLCQAHEPFYQIPCWCSKQSVTHKREILQNFWQRQSARQVWQIHTHQMNACQELSREVKFDAAYTTQLQVLKLSRSPFAAHKIMLARFLVTASIQVQTF